MDACEWIVESDGKERGTYPVASMVNRSCGSASASGATGRAASVVAVEERESSSAMEKHMGGGDEGGEICKSSKAMAYLGGGETGTLWRAIVVVFGSGAGDTIRLPPTREKFAATGVVGPADSSESESVISESREGGGLREVADRPSAAGDVCVDDAWVEEDEPRRSVQDDEERRGIARSVGAGEFGEERDPWPEVKEAFGFASMEDVIIA